MIKPMLAVTLERVEDAPYPLIATPKIDGVRCITMPEPVSRKLKPIPNEYVRANLISLSVYGLDGELMLPDAKHFGDVTSAFMSKKGSPKFEYHVFDMIGNQPYIERIERLDQWMKNNRPPRWLKMVEPVAIDNADELLKYEEICLADGYEGVIVRTPNSPYKYGRSTLNEGYMLKLKRFKDAEAVVYDTVEYQHNTNPAKKDNLGHTERSTAKAGKVPAGMLGKLCVRNTQGIEFEVGTGFTQDQRKQLWAIRSRLIGRTVKYKYQPAGAKDKPRFPVFLGFRHKDDM